MPALCRMCFTQFDDAPRCPSCHSPRMITHPELWDLSVAHMDCDAFFASVEKRDNPDLADKPVIIGGGRRGVVSTACYLARVRGVRSAMPMFQARKLCPDAVVLPGRMEVYAKVSRQVRALMEELTPAIEPLSLDEAFMDLTGTARLHGAPPAVMLARLVKRMQDEIGITGSVGLSHNKFLAKIASDLDKPRGFAVIGRAETEAFLADKPVSIIWGVGKATVDTLDRAGIRTIKDLRRWDQKALADRFGASGLRMWHLARGEDSRGVSNARVIKSITNETTFRADTGDETVLDGHLWRMAEKVSARAKAKGRAGRVVVFKLKTSDHKTITRRRSLQDPSNMAEVIYAAARPLLTGCLPGRFRLIGTGIADLVMMDGAEPIGDLLEDRMTQARAVETARDAIRAKFGPDAIKKGRGM